MEFGDVQFNNVSLTSSIVPFTFLDVTPIVSLSARISNDISSPHMEIVTRFVISNIVVGFTPQMMILVEWKHDAVCFTNTS